MCSRYEQNAPPTSISPRFGLAVPTDLPRPEVRPTDRALVIGQGGASVQVWGLKAAWDGSPLINARAESIHEKPSFKGLVQSRVLVPATSWWEWMQSPKGKSGRKMRLRPKELDLFAFAGLSDGERFTILTCDAPPEMNPMNDRAPVILARQDEADWLNPEIPYAKIARALLPRPLDLTITADGPEPPQLDLFG